MLALQHLYGGFLLPSNKHRATNLLAPCILGKPIFAGRSLRFGPGSGHYAALLGAVGMRVGALQLSGMSRAKQVGLEMPGSHHGIW